MTPERFRALALELPGAAEQAHVGHPDFRIGGKVFASLGYPDGEHAMVKLSPEQQQELIDRDPNAFFPAAKSWGKAGATLIHLPSVQTGMVRTALKLAAGNLRRD